MSKAVIIAVYTPSLHNLTNVKFVGFVYEFQQIKNLTKAKVVGINEI